MAATYVFDTGFMYALAADQGYATTVLGRWSQAKSNFVVPGRVVGEIGSHRGADKPPEAPELPRKAQGVMRYWGFATAQLTDDELRGLSAQGFDGYLRKPFHVRQVIESVEDAMAVVY